MKKNVVIDGRCFTGAHNGYTVFTGWVVSVLIQAGHSVKLVSDSPIRIEDYTELKGVKVSVFGKSKTTLWEQIYLLKYLRRTKPDVYLCGLNLGLPILYFGKTKLTLGLLDMIPQRFADLYIKTWRDRLHFWVLQRLNVMKANQIITISDASKYDIAKYMHGKNVRRVYIRRPGTLLSARKMAQHVADNAIFLYIGGIDNRKRVDNLCVAFEGFLKDRPKARLRLVGAGYEDMLSLLDLNEKTRGSIVELGRITDKQLVEEISRASAIVFPSIYEGYGLPIAEAIMAGKPVICGEGGSQKEIGGDIAVYVDPLSPNSIRVGLQKIFDKKFLAHFKDGLKERQAFISSEEHDKRLLEALGL